MRVWPTSNHAAGATLRAPLSVPPVGMAIAVLVTAFGAAMIAFAAAQIGFSAQVLIAGAIGLGGALFAVQERRLLLLTVMVLSIQVVFHKALGPLNVDIASGAPGLFITSIDVLLIVLYLAWLLEGTLFRDLREGLRRPIFFVPVLAPLAVLPSLLMAESLNLSVGELVRMGALLALFLCVGLRVRSRREIAVLLGAFCLIAFAQAGIAAAQWKAGSTLGLVAIGQGVELVPRVAGTDEIPRPSGTIVHPVFFGACMAEIMLVSLGVALGARHPARFLALGAAGAALVALLLAQSRAALLAAGGVAAVMFVWYLWRGRISGRALLVSLLMAVFCVIAFRGYLVDRVSSNFGTDHFDLEVESRMELNQIALVIIRDAPIIGVGLNNFEVVLPRYDAYGLIFADNPVHNLYLLVLAETGIVGLLAMVASFLALVAGAFRLAKARDPFLAALGVGVLAMYGFFLLEEMTVFSLREEVPALTFWIVSGLMAAGVRLADDADAAPALAGAAA